MFDSKTPLSSRIADTMDLLLDFATLGEYGLEPVGRTARACEADRRAPVTRKSRPPRCAATTFASVSPNSPYFDILRGPHFKKEPAATYSPRGLPPKYHRR
jgi:hypothetical protein